jgi:ABC-2 type transport system permease protein
MRKTVIVAKHEFLETVKRKGFIVSLILPLLILLPVVFTLGFVPNMASETPQHIGFVDETGMLQPSGFFINLETIENAKTALLKNEINAFFVVPANYLETGEVTVYSMTGLLSSPPTTQIKAFLLNNLLQGSPLDATLKERIQEPAKEVLITLNEKGEVEEKSAVGFLIPYIIAFLLLLAIMTSSGYLMQGIVVEKESKTVEILLSSLTTDELLTGKILGFGSAGLLQVLIWMSFGVLLLLTPYASLLQEIQISWILMLAIVYFILGYLLFAGSMACVAAPASTVRDAQQGATVFTMLAIIPLLLLSLIIQAPNSVIARILTYIPYTAPVTTMMRISLVNVPISELVASLVILAISVFIVIKLSAKIFRIGILMYGKKMKLQDIFEYLRE